MADNKLLTFEEFNDTIETIIKPNILIFTTNINGTQYEDYTEFFFHSDYDLYQRHFAVWLYLIYIRDITNKPDQDIIREHMQLIKDNEIDRLLCGRYVFKE